MLALLAAATLTWTADNALTRSEEQEGWKLLFDGKTTAGWKNFRSSSIGSGWKVENGALVISDPDTAGDIVSDKDYQFFELKIDFNVKPGQNSGIMFHVVNDGEATWHTGPEVQIFDAPAEGSWERTGDLYGFYRSAVKPKPANEWNSLHLVVRKGKSHANLNGARAFEFELNSSDWNARKAKSKFKDMPLFGKAGKGRIAIQGDHGLVSFKNIKIKELKS
jgi:hypothetical protein